ncbi:MAG: hypothetical protein RJA76_828 [Bacteroidota bacterium]|jgi:hypothetical protein
MKLWCKSFLFLGLISGFGAYAQTKAEKPLNESKENAVRPVDDSNIHYRARLWRRMDMNEKINQPFFSVNNELSKFLVEWVEAGILTPYKNDSLTVKLTPAQFKENMKMDEDLSDAGLSDAEKAAGFGNENTTKSTDAGVDDGWGGASKKSTAKAETPAKANDGFDQKPVGAISYYFPKEISVLEIKEDAIVDRQKSRLSFVIQALTLVIPSSKTKAGFDKPVASFKYKDVYNLFKSNENCIWYNPQNEMKHLNMADAFDLRLFQARIIKKGNPKNQFLSDIYNGDREGLLMSQMIEHQLLEMESDLWEY